jgi:hypothetical protein
MFIHYAYSLVKESGKTIGPLKDLYVIVGDDLVIFDKNLADQVQKNYSDCGVSVQKAKSKFPVGNDCYSEFCSRTAINNVDVSRIPPNLIRNASENWRDIPALLIQMKKRGVQPKVSLLAEIPYLSKVRARGVSYKYQLSQLMLLPLMGEDLSSLARNLDETASLPCRVDQAISYSSVIHILRVTEKLDEAIDKFSLSIGLNHEEYEQFLDIEWGLDSTEGIASPADHC